MKNAFYFILKAPFVLKIFKIFIMTFWSCRKSDLIRKVNFKIHDIRTWLTNCSISQEVKATRQSKLDN